MLMRLFLVVFCVFLMGVSFHSASAEPTPDPRQQMMQEATALRTAHLISQLHLVPAATPSQIASTRKIYEDLIRRFPAEAEPHVVYGEFLVSVEKNEEAFQHWENALKLDSKRHDVLAAEAELLSRTGQIVAAADALEKAVALAPANAEYAFALAHIYTLFRRDLMASRNQTEDEILLRGTACFQRAAELAPENLAYAQAYAETFYTQSKPDWKLALAAWESLLERSPQKDFIRSHLVRVNIRLNDKLAANRYLQELNNPDFASMRASLQRKIDQL